MLQGVVLGVCPELTQLYLKCSALVIGISWVGVSPLSSLSKLNLMRMAIVFINTIQQILAQYITFDGVPDACGSWTAWCWLRDAPVAEVPETAGLIQCGMY